MGFVQCSEQPAWKQENNCSETLIRWPLGNMHLFNAECDVKLKVISLLIMSYSHLHMRPFFNAFLSTAKAMFCKLFGG